MVLNPEMVSHFADKKVLVIGDVMLDSYLIGDAERISPEAPVPVVRIENERHLLGGAGNVARNIAALGGSPTLVGTVGADREAVVLKSLIEEEGIKPALVELPDRPTTVKTRIMARRQQMLRLDRENAANPDAVSMEGLLAAIADCLQEHAVILLSDYNKGLFSATFMKRLLALIVSCPHVRLLVDPKPSNVELYRKTFLLTPNARETGECAGLPVRTTSEILAAGRSILQRLECDHLLTTLGADGMALFLSHDEVWHIPTMARDVFDVTGAGDTVIATLGLSLAAGHDLLSACMLANYTAGLVVAKVGAATVTPRQLREALSRLPSPPLTRWV